METFSALLAICAGNSLVTGEFPTQRPMTRSLMFSLICACINGWVNNREAGDSVVSPACHVNAVGTIPQRIVNKFGCYSSRLKLSVLARQIYHILSVKHFPYCTPIQQCRTSGFMTVMLASHTHTYWRFHPFSKPRDLYLKLHDRFQI